MPAFETEFGPSASGKVLFQFALALPPAPPIPETLGFEEFLHRRLRPLWPRIQASVLRRAFRKAGLWHTIIHARNGQEAISCLTSIGAARLWLPDLLLLDLKMPLVDGFDVLGWLRVISSSLPERGPRSVPVVVLSASRLPQDKERAKDLGAHDYLVKPVNSDEWITIAKSLNERWLGGRRRPGFH